MTPRRTASVGVQTPSPRDLSTDGGTYLLGVTRRAAAGDESATHELLQTVAPAMKRVIVGVLGAAHADIDDVVQQSLIGLVQGLTRFRGECHPTGYATRIALHVALRARNRVRIQGVRQERLFQLSLETEEAPSPHHEAGTEQRRKVIRDLLQDLPEEQADSLALRVMLGWSLEEVAQATGAPLNTVRSRVRLAKEALRRRIDASPELAEDLEVGR